MPRAALLALIVLAAGAALPGQTVQPAERIDRDAILKIRDEALNRSRADDTLFWLTDRYGPRLHGSPEFEEAGDWAVRQLQTWGLTNVQKERFPSGPGWSLVRFNASMVDPRVMPIVGVPKARTPGTSGRVTAEVVRPIISSAADAERYRGTLRGKIVLTQPARPVRMLEHGDGTVLRYDDQGGKWRKEAMSGGPPRPPAPVPAPDSTPAASPRPSAALFDLDTFYRQEGVVALFDHGPSTDLASGGSLLSWRTQRTDGGTVVADQFSSFDDPALAVPEVTLAVEHYNRMVRLIDHGVPVRVEIELDVKWVPEVTPRGFNIVGDLPGTDKAGEIVLVGAHFDSFHGATGATDNAAGVTAMMEALRVLSAVGLRPRRTIRIGLWGDEESGSVGSKAYVARHLGSGRVASAGTVEDVGVFQPRQRHRPNPGRVVSRQRSGPAHFRGLERAAQGPWGGPDLAAMGGPERSSAIRGRRPARISVRTGALRVRLAHASHEHGLPRSCAD